MRGSAPHAVAMAAWLAAAFAMPLLPRSFDAVAAPAEAWLPGALAMALLNGLAVGWRWRQVARPSRARHWTVPLAVAVDRARDDPSRQWLGRGFEWTPLHAQRMQRLLQAGRAAPVQWSLDGVEPRSATLTMSASALGSHTLVFGQTGTGKTRLAELLVASFLARHRDAVVLIVDPKGDRGLQSLLVRACAATGRPDALVSLHPAFPEQSVRFDPLRNFARASSIATRITSLLPASGEGDAFVQFAWRAINRIVEAMLYAGLRPTLLSIRHCLEDDARPLLARALQAWEQHHRGRPADDGMQGAAASGARDGSAARAAGVLEPGLTAAVARYRERLGAWPAAREPAIDGLLSLVLHDPVHLSKMIQNVLPLLTALTSGVLGPLLSPDASASPQDRRPVFDARKVIEQRRCLYLGLDALVDPVVAGAIGAIVLADLAQVAGERFNDRSASEPVPVLVFIDEAAEVVNPPLLQLLNKARGAGFSICLAAQTVHDFEARLGSAAAARMLLGNPGNLVALRTVDVETQRFCAGSLAPVSIEAIADARSTGIRRASGGADAVAAIGLHRDYREVPLFAPEWLGLLPDLHYVARIAGGRTVKGQLPRLIDDDRSRACGRGRRIRAPSR